MTPAARDIITRATVKLLIADALEGARGKNVPSEPEKTNNIIEPIGTNVPRPVLVLPSEHARLRRMLMGLIVHRPTLH